MENNETNSQKKVKELFDLRATESPDCNSVLDATNNEDVKFQNIFRDYHTKKLAKYYVNPNKDEVLLDFGCGVGRLSEFLAPNTKRLIGTDLSQEMLNVARKNSKNQNVEYKTINEFQQIEEAYFDKLLAFWVLGHIEDEVLSQYISKFHKILKSGGTVFVFEQTRPSTVNFEDVLIQRTEENYINLFTKGGFKLVEKKNVFRFPSYGMDVWKKIGLNNTAALKLARLIENWTVNRKPDQAEYYTQLFIFKKA